MRAVGSIYSRDKSSSSKSHVSSTDKSMEDCFPVSKYLMGSTVKSAPGKPSAADSHGKVSNERISNSPHRVTFSKQKDVRMYSQCDDDSLASEQDVYCEMMSSIRIGNISNMDSLEQLNRTHQSNNPTASHPQTPTGENHFSCKSDSLQKYEQQFLCQPLNDITNKPQLSADNRTIKQLMCLQNLFREVVLLKEFEELKGKA